MKACPADRPGRHLNLGVNGLDFGRRDVGKRAEDRIADLVKKAMQNKISADSNRAGFALAA
jgi:hypothetical protein